MYVNIPLLFVSDVLFVTFAPTKTECTGTELAKVLTNNKTLKCLNLSWNSFKDVSVLNLRKSVLEELDLSYNNISDENFESFAKSLQKNKTLQHLNLRGNRLGASPIESLARYVRRNTKLLGLHLEENQGTMSSFGFVKYKEKGEDPCHVPYVVFVTDNTHVARKSCAQQLILCTQTQVHNVLDMCTVSCLHNVLDASNFSRYSCGD